MNLYPSTKNLDHLLFVDKNTKDTRGLGYVENFTSSSIYNMTKFVKSLLIALVDIVMDKEKVVHFKSNRTKSARISKSRNILVCRTCGIKGHTFKIYRSDYYHSNDYYHYDGYNYYHANSFFLRNFI